MAGPVSGKALAEGACAKTSMEAAPKIPTNELLVDTPALKALAKGEIVIIIQSSSPELKHKKSGKPQVASLY